MEKFRGINFTLHTFRISAQNRERVTCSNCGENVSFSDVVDDIDDPDDVVACPHCGQYEFDTNHQP
ncbi:hypothetical protein [Pantoea eucrina]|uniref:hypothetical protein n=1 Tax=Pantoea eucrina TaxID=472693 RepID=UPI0011129A72|nr:hypothetical protein [Pantoea eucrina]